MRRITTLVPAAILAFAAIALSACSSQTTPADTAPSASSGTASALSGHLVVDAASSLKAGFDEIAVAFQAANPGVTVDPIDYDGSSTLVTQLTNGAKADVFASADQANMQKVVSAGLVTGDTPLFATNTLVIIVPKGNPNGVQGLADLANPALKVDLCAAVLTKVASGEADAGLVYTTDAVGAADKVDAITPANADQVVNRYPIAALDAAPNPDAAKAFVAFVTGPQGQAILAKLGFGAPAN